MYTNMCREDVARVQRELDKVLKDSERALESPETAVLWERLRLAKSLLGSVVTAIDEVVG